MTDTIERVYFTIPEVANQLGIAQSHVRHYLKEFNIKSRGKWKSTQKLNTDQVCLLGIIHHEVTVEGRHYWKIKEIITNTK